ncbi:MAG: hypothetical protein K8I30_07200, partial [Anaerolineae bacterium]|nr:hypothetical protein [Anaerolineae bacterium]
DAPAAQLAVSYDINQNLFIDFGGSSYTLFWDGDTYYQYRKGNRFMISVVTYDGGASLNWSSNGCYVSSPLAQEGAPTPTPIPVEPTSEAHTDAGSMAGSSFSTTWDVPANMCAEENKALLPDLSGAVLTAQADGSFLFSVGGSDYILTNSDGIHGYTEMSDDGSMLSIGMNGFYEGEGMGSFSVVTSGGYCIAMLTFKPQ